MKKIIQNPYQTFFSLLVLFLLVGSTVMSLHVLQEEAEVLPETTQVEAEEV